MSNEAAKLDDKIKAWRAVRFTEAVPYVYADAMYEKVRTEDVVVSKGVLIVSGVDINGNRRVLDFRIADTESEATYSELFGSLKERGLHGVEMGISDAHQGLADSLTARHGRDADLTLYAILLIKYATKSRRRNLSGL